MPQTTLIINAVLMKIGPKCVRFPAPKEGEALGAFLQDMLADGYTPEIVGDELHLTKPAVGPEPLPPSVSRSPIGPIAPKIPVSLRLRPVPTKKPHVPSPNATGSNIVSLSEYRNRAKTHLVDGAI